MYYYLTKMRFLPQGTHELQTIVGSILFLLAIRDIDVTDSQRCAQWTLRALTMLLPRYRCLAFLANTWDPARACVNICCVRYEATALF